jgi:histidinol-phosphate/aromatic aminotransferase/cobyric acid decarboxylase-like protein
MSSQPDSRRCVVAVEAETTRPLRVHGGLLDAELERLGLHPSSVLDFSASCNPYGPCAAVERAVRDAPLDRYPDPTAYHARVALARLIDESPDHLVLGNGAAELLWTIARAWVRRGTRVLIAEPTFGEFASAVARAGGCVFEWRADASDAFRIDLHAIVSRAYELDASIVYLCTPNTPTGAPLEAPAILSAATCNPRLRFVVDQSFLSLSARFDDLRCRFPANVICVRSLTKEHGIPGVRLGYSLSTPVLAERLEAERPAWTTSAQAQAAAIAASCSQAFVAESRSRMLEDRARLETGLITLDLHPTPSSTGFSLVRTGGARELRERLLCRHAIAVRDCSSFGLPDFIRIAARGERDVARLLHALAEERTW